MAIRYQSSESRNQRETTSVTRQSLPDLVSGTYNFFMVPESVFFPSGISGRVSRDFLTLACFLRSGFGGPVWLLVYALKSSDKLTHHLLTWPMTQDGTTMKDVASTHLSTLGMTLSLSSLVMRPYPVVKLLTSAAVSQSASPESPQHLEDPISR